MDIDSDMKDKQKYTKISFEIVIPLFVFTF